MSDVASMLFTLAPHLRNRAKTSSNYIMIQCPFHGGGNERTPSMSVSLEKPVFFCHACQESGHVSRLLRHFGLPKDVALQVVKDARMSPSKGTASSSYADIELYETYGHKDPFRGIYILDDEILDAYRQAPLELLRQGFTKKTLRHFEVGFDDTNLRITFPLRNIYGDLVGISGRTVVGAEPRYKIYRQELFDRPDVNVPKTYSMDEVKEALLWHAHVVRPFLFRMDDEALIITEGFKACMWIWQTGYQVVAALVGAYLSDLHAELIIRATRYVVLFLDNNEAGWKGTYFAACRLEARGAEVKIARYPDAREQPDDLSPDEITKALKYAQTFNEWRNKNDRLLYEEAWRRLRRQALR